MITRVTLREKPIANGMVSLYLDFYPPIRDPKTNKETRREFLKMTLVSDRQISENRYKDSQDRNQVRHDFVKDNNGNYKRKKLSPLDLANNANTKLRAEQLRNKRDNELNKPEIYNEFEKEQNRVKELGEQDFIAYFKMLSVKKRQGTRGIWESVGYYLIDFAGESKRFADITEAFCNDFRDYLQSTTTLRSKTRTLSVNSASSYFNKFKAALRQAQKDGILQQDLNAKIDAIKEDEVLKEHLTIKELNTLVDTECRIPCLKYAALFSAFTGLRFSDIAKMTWGELQYVEGRGYSLKFKQQKTSKYMSQPVIDQAMQLLGEPGDPADKVFPDIKYSAYNNKLLKDWISAADITKKITFHSFRHSFITQLINNDVDIYIAQVLSGHKDIRSTAHYANANDTTRRRAAGTLYLDSLEKKK